MTQSGYAKAEEVGIRACEERTATVRLLYLLMVAMADTLCDVLNDISNILSRIHNLEHQ
ncbi:hypothetical protein BT69DRAFT_1288530, partial [Atractiella rhizophila]